MRAMISLPNHGPSAYSRPSHAGIRQLGEPITRIPYHGVIAEHRGQIAVLTVEKAEEREGRLKAEALAAELAAENAAQAAPARRRAALPDAPDRLATTHICAFRRGGVTRKTPPDPTSMPHQINVLG